MNLYLQYNHGFSWYHNPSKHVWVKGVFIDNRENIISNHSLCDYFDVDNIETFTQRVKESNGIFTVIKKFDDGTYALACDRIRMFPLFYDEHTISDSGAAVSQEVDNEIIPIFLATGFTPRERTLLKNVRQLQAGEIATIDKGKISTFFYYSYTSQTFSNVSYNEAKEGLYRCLQKALDRMVTQFENRQVVLCLSGGFDSRALLVGMKERGYQNVLCLSFGRYPNKEQQISEKLAKALGYPWHFVEYKPDTCQNYLDEKLFRDYYRFSANYTASFYLMYFFALKQVTEQGLIEPDAIFLTGYSGDLLGGSQLFPAMQRADIDYYCNYLYGKTYALKKLPKKLKYSEKARLKSILNTYPFLNYTVAEDVLLKEKVVKLVINSANVFHFFGHETRYPLFDHDLMDFCVRLPFEFRLYKKLYKDVLTENYFKPHNIFFGNEMQPTPAMVKIQILKEKIKTRMPYLIRKHFINKNDFMNYELLTNPMIQEMKTVDYSGHNYNSIVAQWYIYKLLQSLKNQ